MSVVVSKVPAIITNLRQLFGLKVQPTQLGQFTKSKAFDPTGYAGLSTGVASGRIVSTGVKVGIGTGAAGAGIAGLGYGLTEVAKPIGQITDPIDSLVGVTGIGSTVLTLAVIAIILLFLIMVLRK